MFKALLATLGPCIDLSAGGPQSTRRLWRLPALGTPGVREVSCAAFLSSDKDLFLKFQIKYGKYCLITEHSRSTVLNAPVIELPFHKSPLEHNQEQAVPHPFNRYVS